MGDDPVVSIIIPAYESHVTVAKCLDSIQAQDMRAFEVIMIDSSSTNRCEQIILKHYPWVRYEHVPVRMLPHEARNYGVAKSSTDKLIFTDPDVSPPPDWLSNLTAAHDRHGDIVVGSVICSGTKWLDQGTHIAKFDLWLTGGKARPIEIAPTLNFICPREVYDDVGGFPGEHMIGDTIFSWKVAAAGYSIHFSPEAEVIHHHVSTWPGLIVERYRRGREFGTLRAEYHGWSRARILLHLFLTLSPLRWTSLMLRILRHTIAANMLLLAFWTLPISMTAQAAWLIGEARGFLDILFGNAKG